MKLAEIAAILRGEVRGDGSLEMTRLVHPADAILETDLALALTDEAAAALKSPAVAAVVRPDADVPADMSVIVYQGHERMALATLTKLFDPGPQQVVGIDARAVIATDAVVEGASIGPLSAVGARSTVGAGTIVLPGATIGADVVIGKDCLIHPGVRIGDRVQIGDRVVVQPNAVIGGDGFAFIPVRTPEGVRTGLDRPARIHAIGSVVVGDDVEIGASTTIDRGTLRDTRIGNGTKIDNQVQIAHNVVIGENVIICGMVGIAGSAEIGDRTILAASAGIADHIKIGADVTVSALAGVAADVPDGQVVDGIPALRRDLAAERFMNIGRLRQLYPRVDDLRKRLEALEKDAKGG